MIALGDAIDHIRASKDLAEQRLGDRALENYCELLAKRDEDYKEIIGLREKLGTIEEAIQTLSNLIPAASSYEVATQG